MDFWYTINGIQRLFKKGAKKLLPGRIHLNMRTKQVARGTRQRATPRKSLSGGKSAEEREAAAATLNDSRACTPPRQSQQEENVSAHHHPWGEEKRDREGLPESEDSGRRVADARVEAGTASGSGGRRPRAAGATRLRVLNSWSFLTFYFPAAGRTWQQPLRRAQLLRLCKALARGRPGRHPVR